MDGGFSSKAKCRVHLASEGELGFDAEVFVGAFDTGEHNIVVAVWGVRWNGPAKGVFQGVLKVAANGILVVQWSTIPGNMDMNLIEIDGIGQDADKVEADIGSLLERIWVSVSGISVQGEDTLVIIALRPLDLGGVTNNGFTSDELGSGVLGRLDQVWHDIGGHEVLDVEWVDLEGISRDTGGEGQESTKLHFFL